jgi:hypothetical protein
MSVLNTLPAPVIQMGLVGKIVNQQQNQPYALHQAGQEVSRELLRAESLRVASTDPSKPGSKIREQEERQGGGKHQASGKRSADSKAGQDAAGQEPVNGNEPGSPGANPWAGKIVNVKI